MPNWGEIQQRVQKMQAERLQESARFQAIANPFYIINEIKREYLDSYFKKYGRNVIAYYSGWLSKPPIQGIEINDEDKNGFMMAIHGLARSRGLDLILHTPGGGITPTQSIVNYLHKMFKVNQREAVDIRAIVPQIAMSAGTMMACSCKEIWMAKHSNLGPIDPQLNGVPAQGVIAEFKRACEEVKDDPSRIPIWQSIIGQYTPAYLGLCENAVEQSNTFVRRQLTAVMFKGQRDARKKAAAVVKKLGQYTQNKTHSRHIHFEECEKIGLIVKSIEDDAKDERGHKDDIFQDYILTIHHCYMHLLMNTPCFKIIENQVGGGYNKQTAIQSIQRPNQSGGPSPI